MKRLVKVLRQMAMKSLQWNLYILPDSGAAIPYFIAAAEKTLPPPHFLLTPGYWAGIKTPASKQAIKSYMRE
ncbi:MAG TPA: hypothetical protein DEB25_02710 [Desulfobulbaceae bacterium]|nr:hypothetical protein [Desulfobulbaceae bacterium]